MSDLFGAVSSEVHHRDSLRDDSLELLLSLLDIINPVHQMHGHMRPRLLLRVGRSVRICIR